MAGTVQLIIHGMIEKGIVINLLLPCNIIQYVTTRTDRQKIMNTHFCFNHGK